MAKRLNERVDVYGGVRIPAGAASGLLAVSNDSGDVSWQTPTAAGFAPTSQLPNLPDNVVGETYPLLTGDDSAASAALTSGTLCLFRALRRLQAGVTINYLAAVTATSGAGTPTNQWMCLVRVSDKTILAKTVDDTTTAWGGNTLKKLAITGGYTPTQDEDVYFGLVVAANTGPQLRGKAYTANLSGKFPGSGVANANTGLTTPASLTTVGTVFTGGATARPYMAAMSA